MARKEIPREISIYINDKEVVNSLTGINRAISQTKNEIGALNKNDKDYQKDLERLGGILDDLTDRQKEFKDEIKSVSKAMDDSVGSFKKFRDGLLSGDLESAKEGFLGLRSELKNLVKTSLEFISTPLGAAIAVLSGIAIGTKKLIEFNQEAEKAAVLIENLSGKTGQVVEDIRILMKSLVHTFEISFDQLAGAVDNLVDTGVAKDEFEALEKIKNGLLTAPDKNEFISSLESTAVTAKQVGLSLEEVIALKKEIEETGVDPEKTFGALQKAGQNLKAQNDVLRKSLTDVFGAGFTDELLAKIQTGQITTVEALDQIGKKSKEVSLDQTEQANISVQLFGKAGLAAGGFSTVLDTVSGGLKRQKEELNGNQKALLELNAANEKLNRAQSELFRINGFGEMWTKMKAEATDAIAEILVYIADLKKDLSPLIDLVAIVFSAAWKLLKLSFEGVLSGIKFGLKSVSIYVENVGKTFNFLRDLLIDGILKIVKMTSPVLEALGVDVDKLQKKLESLKSKDIVVKTKTTEENPKASKTKEELAEEQRLLQEALDKQKALRDAARQKEEEARRKAAEKKKAEQEKAAKEELDRMLALVKAKGDLAKAELNFFIANERSKLDSTKALTPEIIAEETDRLERIKDKQLNALAEERLAKVEKAQAEAKSAEELAILKYTIDLEYETQRQNLEVGFQASTDALKKQYEEEQKVLKAEQLAADNELALMEAENKFEADKIKQEQDYQAQLAGYKKLLDDKKITGDEYLRYKDAAERQQAEIDKQRELGKVNASLGALGQLANALGELFGQSKDLAIAQAGINGAMAITSILAAAPVGNVILDGILKGVAIGAAVLSVAAQVKQINKAKAPKKPKFFYGGFTGNTPHYGYDEFGPMTGMVHDGEYVVPKAMVQSPRYANTIAWIEQERTGRKAKKFAEGGFASTNEIPPEVINENDSEMKALLQALLIRLDNPVSPNLLIGYDHAKSIQDLNDERKASDQNGIVND